MVSGAALAPSTWRPVDIAGEAVAADAGLWLQFERDGRVAGHGGCNAFTARYTIDAVNLAFGPLAMTRKAGPPALMARETAFAVALEATRLFLRDGARLTFKDARGVSLLRLVQIDLT